MATVISQSMRVKVLTVCIEVLGTVHRINGVHFFLYCQSSWGRKKKKKTTAICIRYVIGY